MTVRKKGGGSSRRVNVIIFRIPHDQKLGSNTSMAEIALLVSYRDVISFNSDGVGCEDAEKQFDTAVSFLISDSSPHRINWAVQFLPRPRFFPTLRVIILDFCSCIST